MNSKTKRRMIVVAGIIVIVAIVLMAVVGAGSSAKVATVTDVAQGKLADKKVQVTGAVVDNSYTVDEDGVLEFDLREQDNLSAPTIHVSFDKGVSATFGNGVVAICTGRVDGKTIVCSELVTKCPSKYESATDALSVRQLLGYGENMLGKTTKVSGVLVGPVSDATKAVRFMIMDAEDAQGAFATTCFSDDPTAEDLVAAANGQNMPCLPIVFAGALSDEVVEDTQLVIMGALDQNGRFLASDVAIGA